MACQWQSVATPPVHFVRNGKDGNSLAIAIKVGPGIIGSGKQDGEWLELVGEPGYCAILSEDPYLGDFQTLLTQVEVSTQSNVLTCAKTFHEGDSVVASGSISAVGRKADIRCAQVGRILEIDQEGDAQIDFEDHSECLWVYGQDFIHFSEHEQCAHNDVARSASKREAGETEMQGSDPGPSVKVYNMSGCEILCLPQHEAAELQVHHLKMRLSAMLKLSGGVSLILTIAGRILQHTEALITWWHSSNSSSNVEVQLILEKQRHAKPDGDWSCPAPFSQILSSTQVKKRLRP